MDLVALMIMSGWVEYIACKHHFSSGPELGSGDPADQPLRQQWLLQFEECDLKSHEADQQIVFPCLAPFSLTGLRAILLS